MTDRQGALSPLLHRTFRWLWIATVVSTTGIWMQTLGAQWFLVSGHGDAALVALVQTAAMLPMAVLALPAGVLADNVDRRKLLIVVQSVNLVVGISLTALTAAGVITAWSLLALTALLGCGAALTVTPFNSLVPELVARNRVQQAAALGGVSANIARVVGPAVAGLVVAWIGIPAVFALNATTTAFFLVVLVMWNGKVESKRQRERFFPAMRTGVRYVRHSPQVLKLMLRSFWFTMPMMAVFALLPLVATQQLGMGSSGYGVLFACLGAGAIVGGLSIARLRIFMSTNAIVAITFSVAVVGMALVPFIHVSWLAMVLMAFIGWSWTATFSSMAGAIQVYLPAWVRARGLSLNSMALFAGQAIGSVIIGWVAQNFGLSISFWGAAGFLAIGVLFAIWLPIRELDDLDRTPTEHWPEPSLVVDPEEIGGEVIVRIIYWIDRDIEEEFVTRMEYVRRVRLRTGGTSWRLLKDAEAERRYVEEYTVGSWAEHEVQHHGRLVASDQEVEQLASELSDPRPTVQHLFRLNVRGATWR